MNRRKFITSLALLTAATALPALSRTKKAPKDDRRYYLFPEVLPEIERRLETSDFNIICGAEFMDHFRAEVTTRTGDFPQGMEFSGRKFTHESMPWRCTEELKMLPFYDESAPRISRINPAWLAAPIEYILAFAGSYVVGIPTKRVPPLVFFSTPQDPNHFGL